MRKGTLSPSRLAALALALAACSAPPTASNGPTANEPSGTGPAQQAPPPAQLPTIPANASARQLPGGGVQLPNGLGVYYLLGEPDRSGMATLGVRFACGGRSGRPGLAELAADAFVTAADSQSGRPSLQQEIQVLDGTLRTEVGAGDTWILMRVPQARIQDALHAVAAALPARTLSRNQLLRLRDDLARRLVFEMVRDLDGCNARQVLLGRAGIGDLLGGLTQRDPTEVAMFQARYYRPEGTWLTLHPGCDAMPALVATYPTLQQWQAPPPPLEANASERQPPPDGLYWFRTATDSCRALLLLPAPDPDQPHAAAFHVLRNCMTMDGLGGRLELFQRQAGLGEVNWRARFLDTGAGRALVLLADTDSAHALQLYELVAATRQSLRDTPPSASEFELAQRRSMLTAVRGELRAEQWLQAATDRTVHDRRNDDLTTAIQALRGPADPEFAAAAAEWAQQPLLFAVLGGTPPAGAPALHEMEPVPTALLADIAGVDQPTRARTAAPVLDAVVDAVGGRERLLLYAGCEAKSRSSGAGAPEVEESDTWRDDGTLRQDRSVLGTVIATRIDAKGGSEGVEPQLAAMTAADVAARRERFRRHPLALLAAYARGDLQFQLLTTRHGEGRTMLVYETLGEAAPRLRLVVDQDSNLIRTVEVWDTTTAATTGNPVFVQESWSDYRAVQGLRVPFRRVTDYDDGSRRSETVWSSFRPLFR